MMALFIAAVGLIVLLGALFVGKFNFGFDDFTGGWPVTRHDNPWGYWVGIVAMIALVLAIGSVVAANYGIDIELPKFKL